MVLFPFQADLSELLGLKDFMGVMYFITMAENVVPVSDEYIKVTEEKFDGVEVVLYEPKQRGTELKAAVIYLHGGGWCLGSASKLVPLLLILMRDGWKTNLCDSLSAPVSPPDETKLLSVADFWSVCTCLLNKNSAMDYNSLFIHLCPL